MNGEPTLSFIRRRNVERYWRLLNRATSNQIDSGTSNCLPKSDRSKEMLMMNSYDDKQ